MGKYVNGSFEILSTPMSWISNIFVLRPWRKWVLKEKNPGDHFFIEFGNFYKSRQQVSKERVSKTFFWERNIFSKNLFRARSSGPGTTTEVSAHRYHASLREHRVSLVVVITTDNWLQRSLQSKYFDRFSRKEIKRIYWSFKNECPSGLVNQETFHAIYSKFFPAGGRIWHKFLINFLKCTKLYWTAPAFFC